MSNIERKLSAVFRVIFGKIFVYETMFVFETVESKVQPKTVGKPEVHVRLAQDSDIPKLSRFRNLRGGKVEERLKAGNLCFIAEKGGDVANYTWVCFKGNYVSELERNIQIESGSAYRYDGYTVPKYRGMGILPIVLTTIADYLFQSGVKEIYDCVGSNNFSSLRSHRKIGSRKIGEITLIRLFKTKRYRCEGESPRDLARLKQLFLI